MRILQGLFDTLRTKCADLFDKRRRKEVVHSMQDIGMAAFSIFFMQSASFLQHQRWLRENRKTSNCETLFQMKTIPSDNHVRSMLDGINPNHFDNAFAKNLRVIDEEKALEPLKKLGNHILIALDGTEYLRSYKLACANCSHRLRKNGKMEFFHSFLGATVVSPGQTQAIPLPPEHIVPQDGHDKQDCESVAARRWLNKHAQTYAAYHPIYLGDDLFAKQPICEEIQSSDGHFIFTCKPDSHKALFEYVLGATFEELEETVLRPGDKTRTYHYRWVKNAPLRDSADAMKVTYIEVKITDTKGKETYRNSFVTDLDVHKGSVTEIVACGRSRWKIENEKFNTLKNNGYHLKHNFGHGEKTLASVLTTLNLLAFAFHTTCELTEKLWQQARIEWKARKLFFSRLWTLTSFFIISSWDELMQILIDPPRSLRSLPGPSG